MKSHPRTMAAVLAAGVILTSCATGTSNNKSSETASFHAEATVSGKLTVMGFGASDEIATTRLDKAKAAMPNVTVSLIEGDLDIQQFLSAVASGKPPEIIYAGRDQIGTFASRGAIMPLDQCISAEKIAINDFRRPAIDQVTVAKQVYGVPEFNQVEIIMANSALLGAAGLSLADVDGSKWDAIDAAATALHKTAGGKLAVIGFDSKLPEFLPLWAKANGADLISKDGRTATLDDPKVVEALEFAAGIYTRQGGFSTIKAFRDSADFFGAGNQFAKTQLGAMPMEQWYVNVLNDVSPGAEVQFTTLKGRDGAPLSFSTGSAWAIPTASANPEAACRFIKTMTAKDTWMAAAAARAAARAAQGKPFTGLFTGNKVADDAIHEKFVKTGSDAKWDAAITASYTANDNSFSLPANPAGEEFTTAWQDAANRVLNGQQNASDALAQAQKEAQAALDAAWKRWDAKGK